MEWLPATKEEVLTPIEADWTGIDPTLRARLSSYLIEPRPALVERFGQKERAFVVAQINRHVVFFDDIENDFSTAEVAEDTLLNVAAYGSIALALRELERLGSNVR